VKKPIFFLILSFFIHSNGQAQLPAGLINDSKTWASEQNDSEYVIQLMSAKQEKYLLSPTDIQAIENAAGGELVYHPKVAKGTTWHTVIWGPFATRDEATAAHGKLSPKWTKNAPWVRKIASLKFISPKESAQPVKTVAPVITPVVAPKPVVKRKIPQQPQKSTPLTHREPNPTPEATEAIQAARQDPYGQTDAPFHGTIDYHIPRQGTYPYAKLGAGSLTAESDLALIQPTEYTGTLVDVAVGLDIGHYLGVELGYLTLTGGDTEIEGVSNADANNVDTEFSGIKYSGLVKLPFDQGRRWQAFAQLGFIDWELTANTAVAGSTSVNATTNSGTDLFYAGGVEYKFTPQLAFGVKHQVIDIENLDTNATTAELTWRWEAKD
jgi:opacity protein-like surface antigen